MVLHLSASHGPHSPYRRTPGRRPHPQILTIAPGDYEPVRTVFDTVPHPHRTLAGELLRWSAHAFRPDWKYTPEQVRILARWYELRDDAVPEDPNDPETR